MVHVDPHPHGLREQDPGSPRPDHTLPLLHTWCSGRVVTDIPRYQVLQVPCLAGHLAQDEEMSKANAMANVKYDEVLAMSAEIDEHLNL